MGIPFRPEMAVGSILIMGSKRKPIEHSNTDDKETYPVKMIETPHYPKLGITRIMRSSALFLAPPLEHPMGHFDGSQIESGGDDLGLVAILQAGHLS